ncbi:hypothetical protein QT971_01485 [Microcoleus sp. herbarium19]|uniref:hypothetical protein n=1 Tax=unclassified Microcoleus TaxID=2642155 RepID=UPI002FD57B54
MPKFNKPQLNKSQLKKSQFDDRPNQNKSFPSEAQLPAVVLDETIVAGRRPKPLNDFQRLLMEIPELRSGFDPEMFAHLQETLPFNVKQFESKIRQILGSKNIDTSLESFIKYLDYIKKNIQLPCFVTGVEEFEWEEEYTIGSGSKKEYAKLKKTQPSHTDTFKINRLDDLFIEGDRILVEVIRIKDRQKFILPLADLESVDLISQNQQLLDDYYLWFVNY